MFGSEDDGTEPAAAALLPKDKYDSASLLSMGCCSAFIAMATACRPSGSVSSISGVGVLAAPLVLVVVRGDGDAGHDSDSAGEAAPDSLHFPLGVLLTLAKA